jgi:hypothetical protein
MQITREYQNYSPLFPHGTRDRHMSSSSEEQLEIPDRQIESGDGGDNKDCRGREKLVEKRRRVNIGSISVQ